MSEQWGQQPQDQPEPGPTQPQFPQYPQQYPAAPPVEGGYVGGYPVAGYAASGEYLGPPRNSKLAITSLILGIISLPLVIAGFVGSIVGLVGLILGIVGISGAAKKHLKRVIGITGIALCALGIIGGGLVTVAAVHAANTCKADKGNNTLYTKCVKDNLKL